jgi:hypothetical protein
MNRESPMLLLHWFSLKPAHFGKCHEHYIKINTGGMTQDVLCWRYLKADQQPSEPFSEEGIAELLRSGVLLPDSMIWRDGLAQWVPLKDSEIGSLALPSSVPTAFPLPRAKVASRPGMEQNEAERHVRNMLIAGGLSVIATATFAASGSSILWLDALVTGALLFGVYRASRFCAIALVALYVVGAVVRVAGGAVRGPIGFAVMAIFLYYYIMGVRGTFALHKWRRVVWPAESSLSVRSI